MSGTQQAQSGTQEHRQTGSQAAHVLPVHKKCSTGTSDRGEQSDEFDVPVRAAAWQ